MFKLVLTVAAVLAALTAAVPVSAADTAAAKPAATAQRPIYGSQLMTAQERSEFRARMNAAKTPEERQQLMNEHHAQMQARAKEKGVTLPDAAGPRHPRRMGGAGMGPGGAGRGGMGPGGMMAPPNDGTSPARP